MAAERIAAALLLAVMVLGGIELALVSYSSHQRQSHEHRKPAVTKLENGPPSRPVADAVAEDKHDKGNQKSGGKHIFLDHLPDWFVALFTGMLVVVTIRLVTMTARLRDSTDKLWEAGERQIAAAQLSAEAAQKSANVAEYALRGLERPYLSIEKIDTSTLRASYSGGAKPSIVYAIVNHGKTPAILRSINIRLERSPNLPLRLPLANAQAFYAVVAPSERLLFPGGDDWARIEVLDSQQGQVFYGPDAAAIVFHGSLHYEDATGAYHTDRFCMRANPGGETFRREGGETYNYRETEYPMKPKDAEDDPT